MFNVKADRRNERIRELFEQRIHEVEERTRDLTETAQAAFKESYISIEESLDRIASSMKENNYDAVTTSLGTLYQRLFGKPVAVYTPEAEWDF